MAFFLMEIRTDVSCLVQLNFICTKVEILLFFLSPSLPSLKILSQSLPQLLALLMLLTNTWRHLGMKMNMLISRKPRRGLKLSIVKGCLR